MNELNLEKQLNSPSQKFAKIIHYLKAKLRNEKKTEVRYLEKYIKPHSIIFDIGAQFGQYSKQFANLHDGSCKVFSFEPFNYSRDILNKVISSKKNVKIFSNGFSNKNITSSLFVPIKKSGKLGPGLSNLGDKIHDNFVKQEVQLKTIDDFILDNSINFLNFIKIDIEGYELEALEGGKNSIKKFRPVVKCEVDRNLISRIGKSPKDLFKFFNDLEYEFFIYEKELIQVASYKKPTDYLFVPK